MLKTTKEFDFVYKNSYKFRAETLDICVMKPNLVAQFCAKFGRISSDFVGFSVSKKVGIAVERNLIKRRLRAICREFFVANSPCSDFLGSASAHSLQRTASASHSFALHNPKNSSTMLEFADLNESSLRTNLTQDTRIANDLKNESSLRGTRSEASATKQSKKNRTNLICIFIAKNGILQTPFGALKENIFATLKRQVLFMNRNAYQTKNALDSAKLPKNTRDSANRKNNALDSANSQNTRDSAILRHKAQKGKI